MLPSSVVFLLDVDNTLLDNDLTEWLRGVAWQKEARHHIGEPEFVSPPRSMSCIGG